MSNPIQLSRDQQRQTDLKQLHRRQRDRYSLLKATYDLADGRAGRPGQSIAELARHADLDLETARHASGHLKHEGLLTGLDGQLAITHQGVIEVETTIEFPEVRTKHFARTVIQNYFHGAVGVAQSGADARATVTQQSQE